MGMQGDFLQLLKEQGYTLGVPTVVGTGHALTNATTILAFKYRDGVLVAGDRRATVGNTVMYDRTDKVLEIDRDRKSTRLNSSHIQKSRMPSSA